MSLRLTKDFVSSNSNPQERSPAFSAETRSARFIALSVVLGFFAVYCASSIVWTHMNRMPPPWDPSDHYITAYEYYSLAHTALKGFFSDFFSGLHYYPPVFHLGVAFFFFVFGAGSMQEFFINLIALF